MRRCGRSTRRATRPPGARHCRGSWGLHQLSEFRQDFWWHGQPLPPALGISAPEDSTAQLRRVNCGGRRSATHEG
eukprot:4033710-Alexandrium_andersonii.AAC.1